MKSVKDKMEKRIGTVNPPIIMNTFVNEAFEEGDDKIVENNNSTWGNVNLDEMLQTGDIDKTKMSQLLNIPGTPRTRDRKISQICAKVRQEAYNMGTYVLFQMSNGGHFTRCPNFPN